MVFAGKKNSPSSESYSRLHLLNKQDIKNIDKSYGVDEVIRHANDQESVLSWIKEWSHKEGNPILYYKLQGWVFQLLLKILLKLITVMS